MNPFPKIKALSLKAYTKYHENFSLLHNIKKRKNKKNVLLSYIISPFICSKNTQHTNQQEALAIADVFDLLGYNIDVCYFNSRIKINYSNYNCLFGFGNAFINSFYHNNTQKRIYYGTGMHICHQNTATLNRVKEVYRKKGVLIPDSGRIVSNAWSEQTSLVDGMILLGNNTTADTYRTYYDGPIFTQPASYFENTLLEDPLAKNWTQAQKHFLWFGSLGAIHKGLDLLLDIFPSFPEYHLHICGLSPNEKKFIKVYDTELKSSNIHNHGFIDVRSTSYKDLIKKCAFVILPSCSEGQATSLLSVMCNGLIPVLTKYCGIDKQEFTIPIHTLNSDGIISVLSNLKNLSPNECAKLAHKCLHYTREHHSIQMYKQELMKNIIKIL